MNKRSDLIGLRFGRLMATSLNGVTPRGNKWNCTCDCGHTCVKVATDLKKGNVKSCGCLWKDVVRLKKGEAAFNNIFARYKKGAKERGLIFLLDKDTFKNLTLSDCFYCGDKPTTIAKSIYTRQFGDYVYNGIDRVDNQRGYEPDNCVPCCKICNWMKRHLSMSDFLKHVAKIKVKHLVEIK